PRQVELTGHTGQPLPAPTACRVDPAGRLFLVTSAGLALVHSLDMDVAADALVAGLWPEPVELATADILAEAGCRLLPRPG
ncbi:MAG: hypothetical protein RL722_1911, partial [Pseudomonadota bacterium]